MTQKRNAGFTILAIFLILIPAAEIIYFRNVQWGEVGFWNGLLTFSVASIAIVSIILIFAAKWEPTSTAAMAALSMYLIYHLCNTYLLSVALEQLAFLGKKGDFTYIYFNLPTLLLWAILLVLCLVRRRKVAPIGLAAACLLAMSLSIWIIDFNNVFIFDTAYYEGRSLLFWILNCLHPLAHLLLIIALLLKGKARGPIAIIGVASFVVYYIMYYVRYSSFSLTPYNTGMVLSFLLLVLVALNARKLFGSNFQRANRFLWFLPAVMYSFTSLFGHFDDFFDIAYWLRFVFEYFYPIIAVLLLGYWFYDFDKEPRLSEQQSSSPSPAVESLPITEPYTNSVSDYTTPAPTVFTPPAGDTKFCHYCGAKIPRTARFCGICGGNLTNPS